MTGGVERIPVVVVGASGYTGREALRLLAGHPAFDLVGAHASERSAGSSVADLHPSLRGVVDLPVGGSTFEEILATGAAAALLATPHEVSAHLAPALAEAGLRVVDLSGAFRLPAALYPAHYGFEHPSPGVLARAVYGLPELSREGLGDSPVIGVAGCYATAASLPLAPVVRAGLVDPASLVVVDAVSGVSGAGRAANERNLFCEVSARAYSPLTHRHQPEIELAVGAGVAFVPHLGPWDRGIVCTTHVRLAPGGAARLREAVRGAFEGEPFVRLLPPGVLPSVGAVAGTPFIDIGVVVDEARGHAVLCSALDNLLKGAASQGVQCLNAALGLPEPLGLLPNADAVARVRA